MNASPAGTRENHGHSGAPPGRRLSGPGAGIGPLPASQVAAAGGLGDHLASASARPLASTFIALVFVPGLPIWWLVTYLCMNVPGVLSAVGASVPVHVGVVLAPLLVFGVVGAAAWQGVHRQPVPVLHLFGNGALLARPGRTEPLVLPRSSLGLCEWGPAREVGESPVPVGARTLIVRDQDGRRLLTLGGPAIEGLAAAAAEVELPRARAELAAGQPVRCGPLVLTDTGLRVGDRELGWTAIGRLAVTGRHVVVRGGPESSLLARVPRRRTPHQRVLLVLAGERIAAGRRAG